MGAHGWHRGTEAAENSLVALHESATCAPALAPPHTHPHPHPHHALTHQAYTPPPPSRPPQVPVPAGEERRDDRRAPKSPYEDSLAALHEIATSPQTYAGAGLIDD
eukprot:42652-Chlamydomonas_euryale.AAC.1